jgi:hypothetical protein
MRSRGPRPLGGDGGDIVLGWLTRIMVFLTAAGLILFDAIAVATTHVSVADSGSYAARQASEKWQETKDLQLAYDTAVATATEQNANNRIDPKSIKIDADDTVHLTISRDAATLLLQRIGPIEHWGQVSEQASGRSIG